MIKHLAGIVLTLLMSQSAFSQVGGEHVYEFLNLSSSARAAALGGEQVALGESQPDMAFHNPALLDSTMDQITILNYVSYLADIHYGFASHTRHWERWGTFSAGIHYINYGNFTQADQWGQITGKFKASEYALILSWSKKIAPRWIIGASAKPIYSVLEKYNSWGMATDLAIRYQATDNLFNAAIVARNMGFQIKPYYGSHQENLPMEILVGMSKKLSHAPFRLALTYRHLEKFNMINSSSSQQSEGQSPTIKTSSNSLAEKGLRHLVVGMEFIPTKNITLRAGYNIQRRQELKIDSKQSTVGLSWGFGVNISRFHLSYASARYHLAGASNHFSISTRLSDFNF